MNRIQTKKDVALPTESLEFRKTNEAIGLRVSEGRLSLLSRKLFNVLVFHAQKLMTPGKNAPVDSLSAQKYFWIPMSDVVRDTAYDSNDTELIKEYIDELQNIRVHMEGEKEWTSERLIAGVKIVNPAGLKKRGGKIWFGFVFPPEVESLIMNPATYTKLSIYYQTMLRSGASLVLYEICRRYATNPSKLTVKTNWQWWYGALSGNPMTEAIPEYKYFKRDTLKPAIVEVNAVTDIQIELIEHKQGRKISDLQFSVVMQSQQSLDFPIPPLINGDLIERMVKLGIGRDEAGDFLASTEEAVLKANLDVVYERMNNRAAAQLGSPAAYFRAALKDGYAKPQAIAAHTGRKNKDKGNVAKGMTIRERYQIRKNKEAIDYYNEINDAQREALIADFQEAASPAVAALCKRSALKSELVRNAFATWLSQRLWGQPTDKELLDFAEVVTLNQQAAAPSAL